MTQARRLIVNGDDFGFTEDVNEGIVEAFRHGILTATTLMANGSAFDHAVKSRTRRLRSTSGATSFSCRARAFLILRATCPQHYRNW